MPLAVDKSPDRVRRMFGEIAPRYDRLNHLLSLNVDRLWRRRLVSVLRPKAGQAALDVCCGTGDLAFEFYRRMPRAGSVVGVDFCPPMLEIARHKQARRGVPGDRLRFVEGDAQALPFDDGQFDHVAVAFGLRNVSHLRQGLAEMVRVCRPGGRVAVLDFSLPRREPIRSLYGWYFRRLLPSIGQRLNGNSTAAYDYLPSSVEQFPTYERLAAAMVDAGLTRVQFQPLSFGIATLHWGVR